MFRSAGPPSVCLFWHFLTFLTDSSQKLTKEGKHHLPEYKWLFFFRKRFKHFLARWYDDKLECDCPCLYSVLLRARLEDKSKLPHSGRHPSLSYRRKKVFFVSKLFSYLHIVRENKLEYLSPPNPTFTCIQGAYNTVKSTSIWLGTCCKL